MLLVRGSECPVHLHLERREAFVLVQVWRERKQEGTGVRFVFDTTIAADFSVLESQKEFVRRFRRHSEEEPTLPMLTSACPGVFLCSPDTRQQLVPGSLGGAQDGSLHCRPELTLLGVGDKQWLMPAGTHEPCARSKRSAQSVQGPPPHAVVLGHSPALPSPGLALLHPWSLQAVQGCFLVGLELLECPSECTRPSVGPVVSPDTLLAWPCPVGEARPAQLLHDELLAVWSADPSDLCPDLETRPAAVPPVSDSGEMLRTHLGPVTGWVRYAERVLGHPVTPHLCTAKSPQQIMGSLVKDYFARRQNLSPDKIFHVIVAPCYDRKLEALQEDVLTASRGSRGADCVLTSGEVAQMMEQSGLSVRDAALDTLFGDVEGQVRRHDGASPDAHLGHIFRHAAKELFNEDVGELTYRSLRNRDFQEVTLEKSGKVLLRFAAAYGFRNIQNVVLKLKKGKFPYHCVEVLACAGGCLSGRGQAQTEEGRADKALLQRMKGIYADVPVRPPETSAHVQELYQEWLDGADSPRVQEALHTARPGPGHPANSRDIKW
ncbi:nuclear prelamin A recognition factor [Camelus ferus]|nr:nuclear prelamin A recognition factor [Camelus ferus]